MNTRQHYHIWIRKPIAEKFELEAKKGELVNKLLAYYYKKQDEKKASNEPHYVPPEPTA